MNNIKKKVWNKICDEFETQVYLRVSYKVIDQVPIQVMDQVKEEIWWPVEYPVLVQVWGRILGSYAIKHYNNQVWTWDQVSLDMIKRIP